MTQTKTGLSKTLKTHLSEVTDLQFEQEINASAPLSRCNQRVSDVAKQTSACSVHETEEAKFTL